MTGYDKYIVTFSGGKDSTACVLHLLDSGIPKEKIELWHHEVDGREETFMDWEITPAYCRAFAKAFGLPIYFSWKEGGFKREMLRNNMPTAPVWFEVPQEEWASSRLPKKADSSGLFIKVGGNGPLNTRLKFPQVSGDMKVRWCSSYLKIDIGSAAIRNQSRFNRRRVLVISGERGQESPKRALYKTHESDRADRRHGRSKRHVDRWRPIKDWTERHVWDIIEKHKVRVHPAYYLGYGRVSCKWCIFGNEDQFATSYYLSPWQGETIIGYEKGFGCTIKRKGSVQKLVSLGTPYKGVYDSKLAALSVSTDYSEPIFMSTWVLPLGAYRQNCGPS